MAGNSIDIAKLRECHVKKRRYFIWGIALLAAYVAVIGALWLVFISPVFRIQNITITGNERIRNDEITGLLYGRIINGRFSGAIFGLNNILIWPDKLAGEDLAMLPGIKSLNIEKSFRGRNVVVRVEEREPYGIWCYHGQQTSVDAAAAATGAISPDTIAASSTARGSGSGDCWWFDSEGFIFQRSLSASGGLIISANDYSQRNRGLNMKILPAEFIANVFSVFNVLKASGLALKEIRLNDLALEEVEVDTYPMAEQARYGASAGPKLYFSLRFSSANDLPVIQDFISKQGFNKLQYLDFRVENRAYYK